MLGERVKAICTRCGATNIGSQSQCLICQAPLPEGDATIRLSDEPAATIILDTPSDQPPAWRLTITKGPGEGTRFILTEKAVLGRAATADIALPNDPLISRRHAVLERNEEGYLIEDQDSGNGTYVDGERIAAPTQLTLGSVIIAGGTALTVELDE